jgi:hypothetical protein
VKKISKGMRKHIRHKKSEIRKSILSLDDQERAIKDFLDNLRS